MDTVRVMSLFRIIARTPIGIPLSINKEKYNVMSEIKSAWINLLKIRYDKELHISNLTGFTLRKTLLSSVPQEFLQSNASYKNPRKLSLT